MQLLISYIKSLIALFHSITLNTASVCVSNILKDPRLIRRQDEYHSCIYFGGVNIRSMQTIKKIFFENSFLHMIMCKSLVILKDKIANKY